MNEPVYSVQPVQTTQHPLYQADSGLVQSVNKAREQLHEVARKYVNHPVRVQTQAGHEHEGVIVQVDECHLYLSVAVNGQARGFFNPFVHQAYTYNNVILPLVLFELLAITLLY